MKKAKQLLLLLLVGSLSATSMYAQETEDDGKSKMYRQRDLEQLDKYEAGEALFPPKPKNNWSVGVKGGLAFVAGDVKSRSGAAFGLSVRKALGHAFSMRLEGNFGRTKGLDYRPRTGYQFGGANNPWKSAGYTGPVFENYQMSWGDLTLQGVLNLNNINFYKEQVRWNIYVAAGVGVMGYNTQTDALDANGNPYDFTSPDLIFDAGTNPSFSDISDEKSRIWNTLDGLLDGTYESPAEQTGDRKGMNFSGDYYRVNPFLTGALGFRYRISRRVELEGEYRIGVTLDDLLDGVRWAEQGDLTSTPDNMNQLTLGIHFRIGPGAESLWWTNPMTQVASDAAEARKLVKRMTDDGDDDGVPDLFDKEPDTPEGMMVDAAGRTLDSDGDGVPDTRDDEPFSPKNAAVDANGVALDTDADGVADIFDKEPGSAPGSLVDAKGIAVNPMTEERVIALIKEYGGSSDCILPMVHYDLNKDDVKPEFYPELYYISQVMKADPSLRVKAVGFTDVRASDDFNLKLSQRRVDNAVDFLVKTYGIDKSRFDVSFEGETQPVIPELPSNYRNPKLEKLHYMNRRVEFQCIK